MPRAIRQLLCRPVYNNWNGYEQSKPNVCPLHGSFFYDHGGLGPLGFFLFLAAVLTAITAPPGHAAPAAPEIPVAAYYYPCDPPDPRWDKAKYPGFTESDLIRKAKPRFPGHKQPKVRSEGDMSELQSRQYLVCRL